MSAPAFDTAPPPQNTSENPTAVMTAQTLFFLNGAIWLLLGIASLVRAADSIAAQTSVVIIPALMFANTCVALWISWGIGKRRRRFFYLAVAFLAVNIILTVTDEFGIFDLITLLIDAALLGLLIGTRSTYS